MYIIYIFSNNDGAGKEYNSVSTYNIKYYQYVPRYLIILFPCTCTVCVCTRVRVQSTSFTCTSIICINLFVSFLFIYLTWIGGDAENDHAELL